jgi:xanthine dehydrogenase accessory factor
METIYRQLAQLEREGLPLALATVVRVRGSVPREVGTKMIIHPLGQHVGTIGGGCGEADVIRAGMQVIRTKHAELVEVDLTDEISMESLGVCGGVMDVLVEPWPPASEAAE